MTSNFKKIGKRISKIKLVEYLKSKEKREQLFFWIIVIFLILLLFFATGCTKLERNTITEEEFDGKVEPETDRGATNEAEQALHVEEPKPVEESISKIIKETSSPQGDLTITPSRVNVGGTITISGIASGNRGFENEITFYPTNKKLRIAETTACRKTSYCYEVFEKEYKLREDIKPGEYYAKIFDRGLDDYVYGYFTIA